MVLRATSPVWGTALSAETAMKYLVSQSILRYTLYLCSFKAKQNKSRLAILLPVFRSLNCFLCRPKYHKIVELKKKMDIPYNRSF